MIYNKAYADIDSEDKRDHLALSWAAEYSHIEVINILL